MQAIKVEGLGKKYRIDGERLRYFTLRDSLAGFAKSLIRPGNRPRHQELWALKDVSFSVNEGEVLGIIGRNGAGKSTLLKVLSRITEPTTGEITIRGRVGALLEVGTGFHPELTGRENVYLNGAVLGMTRREVDRKFDEIVEFAGVRPFIDTPAKRYSSGMFARLAFSVAAHLEPDILVVDEVLAVGDAEFQKRCLGKMSGVASSGRTVLFVSHDMGAVRALCHRAILIEKGQIVFGGTTADTINRYQQLTASIVGVPLLERTDRTGNGKLRFTGISLETADEHNAETFQSGQDVAIRLDYDIPDARNCRFLQIDVGINGHWGQSIIRFSTDLEPPANSAWQEAGSIRCLIPRLPLHPGRYTVDIFATISDDIADWVNEAAEIIVEPGQFYSSGRMSPHPHWPFLVDHRWETG